LSLSESVRLYSSVILIYLLTTRRGPGYPVSYPVGYSGNELPDNGISLLTDSQCTDYSTT